MSNQQKSESFHEEFTKFKIEIKSLLENDYSVMKLKIDEMVKEFQEMSTAMKFLNEKYEEVINENKELKKEVTNLKQANASNSKIISTNQKDDQSIMNKLNDLDNLGRLNNLEIHGIPEVQNEHVQRVAVNVLKISDPTLEEHDIETSFRLKKSAVNKETKNASVSPILVKLKEKNKRINIIKNRKKLAGFDFSNIGIDASRVYINENLTPITKALFYQSNLLKKENNWRSIWTINGVIKMKRNEDSPIITIRDSSDLKKIS